MVSATEHYSQLIALRIGIGRASPTHNQYFLGQRYPLIQKHAGRIELGPTLRPGSHLVVSLPLQVQPAAGMMAGLDTTGRNDGAVQETTKV